MDADCYQISPGTDVLPLTKKTDLYNVLKNRGLDVEHNQADCRWCTFDSDHSDSLEFDEANALMYQLCSESVSWSVEIITALIIALIFGLGISLKVVASQRHLKDSNISDSVFQIIAKKEGDQAVGSLIGMDGFRTGSVVDLQSILMWFLACLIATFIVPTLETAKSPIAALVMVGLYGLGLWIGRRCEPLLWVCKRVSEACSWVWTQVNTIRSCEGTSKDDTSAPTFADRWSLTLKLCSMWVNRAAGWPWELHFATARTILFLWVSIYVVRGVVLRIVCLMAQYMHIFRETPAVRRQAPSAVSSNQTNATAAADVASIHLCEAACPLSADTACTSVSLLLAWVLVGMPPAAQIAPLRSETALEATASERSAPEKINLQLWNFLHACLQCDPQQRPQHDMSSKFSTNLDTAPKTRQFCTRDSIDWSHIFSTGLQGGHVDGEDRFSFPLVDGPVRLVRCEQRFEDQSDSTGLEGSRSGVEAQLVLKPHTLLPFETFRSFRASLTSNRHHSPDLQIILDRRKYRVFVSAVEENDDEQFDKTGAKLGEQVKWAYRTQDKIWRSKVASEDVWTAVSGQLNSLDQFSAALGSAWSIIEEEVVAAFQRVAKAAKKRQTGIDDGSQHAGRAHVNASSKLCGTSSAEGLAVKAMWRETQMRQQRRETSKHRGKHHGKDGSTEQNQTDESTDNPLSIDVPEPCLDGGGGLNFKGPTFDVEDGSPRSVDASLHCVGTGFMPEDEPEPEPEPDCTEFV